MKYKIVRIDGKEDDVTSQTFSNFAYAYDLYMEIYVVRMLIMEILFITIL